VLVALIVVAVVAAGAALGVELLGRSTVRPVRANLTVLVVGEGGISGQGGGRALFHLKCDPAGGNVAQPAKACAAIAAQTSLVTNPKPFYCLSLGGVWYFTITGHLNGKAIRYSGQSCWTTQMALIDKLGLAGPHGQPLRLEPRRQGSVGLGQTHTFAARLLRPGDLVACRVRHGYRGFPLAMSVPVQRGVWESSGAMAGVMKVRLRADGAVIAGCVARDHLPLDKRGRTTFPHGWPGSSA
jgi:hypothetical protein